MALCGSVAFKVKKAVLLARDFTVGQIVDMTGIQHESVETVIQRLLKEGMLTDSNVQAEESGTKRGRPRKKYTFVDHDKSELLRRDIAAFNIEESLTKPHKAKPVNPHFMKATSLINSLDTLELTDDLSRSIESNILLAREYEEIADENNEISLAHIDFLWAKYEHLRGEDEDAENLLSSARKIFDKYDMPEINEIDDYFLTVQMTYLIRDAQKDIRSQNYSLLANKLYSAVTNISSTSFLISSHVLEMIKLIGDVSSISANFMEENRLLTEQIHRLVEENDRLKIQHQINIEINHSMSEAVRNMSAKLVEIDYARLAFPKKGFQDEALSTNSPSVADLMEHRQKRQKVANC